MATLAGNSDAFSDTDIERLARLCRNQVGYLRRPVEMKAVHGVLQLTVGVTDAFMLPQML